MKATATVAGGPVAEGAGETCGLMFLAIRAGIRYLRASNFARTEAMARDARAVSPG